jgi:hypothetical protein
LQEDVLRLEIPVDHAVLVRVVERFRDGDRDAHRLLHRELLLALEPGAERFALHVRHHVPQQAARLAGVEQRQQVRVLEVGGDADLREEALTAEHGAQLGVEHFQGDEAVVPDVAGEIHRRHPAAAQLPLEGVAVGEDRGEAGELAREIATRRE